MSDENDGDEEIQRERLECLVQQGFTPLLARKVMMARSPKHLPLTLWIVDNSGSMNTTDGRKLVSTAEKDDVRLVNCTRWEELKETVVYHAQLSALLEAPTRFVMLNSCSSSERHQELSIAERGSEWIEDDLDYFSDQFSNVVPGGATPLTGHLHRIHQSLLHTPKTEKIVLVLATDGKPTDDRGYTSPVVDRAFEDALKQLQAKVWIVVRLCTDDDSILQYYQRLDDELDLSLEVLDDYVDEAKEVYQHNPWLTYSLGLHRCREMGMSCHPAFRFLDWLDERPLGRNEIGEILKATFGLIGDDCAGMDESILRWSSQTEEDWTKFCRVLQQEQDTLALQKRTKHKQNHSNADTNADADIELKAFFPWNPIQKRTTHWVDIRKLKRHGRKTSSFVLYCVLPLLPIVLVVASYLSMGATQNFPKLVIPFLSKH